MTPSRLRLAALALGIAAISTAAAGEPKLHISHPYTSYEPPATQRLVICAPTGYPDPGTGPRPAWFCEYVSDGGDNLSSNYFSANCEDYVTYYNELFRYQGRRGYAVCEPIP